MGLGSSKTASAAKTVPKASSATPRKYPTRPPPPSFNRTNAQPPPPPPIERVGPSVHPPVGGARGATQGRDRGVELDSSDPDLGLAARLSQLGPVQPNPTQSNSSTFNHGPLYSRSSGPSPPHASSQTQQPPSSLSSFIPSASTPSQSIFPSARQNPAVSLLTARYRLAEEAELEFSNVGRKGAQGRQFLDVITIRQILMLRDEKDVPAGEIERKLGLRAGVVGRLGRKGMVEASS